MYWGYLKCFQSTAKPQRQRDAISRVVRFDGVEAYFMDAVTGKITMGHDSGKVTIMVTETIFEQWRSNPREGNAFGLAWFLANEFCKRFYRSHGIVPHVINREGLGYYGIQLNELACEARPKSGEPLGRLTMCGNIENWLTGGPGDHGLKTHEMLMQGVPTAEIVALAIKHMRLTITPTRSHYSCRHHRWGNSYVLLFDIMTRLVLTQPDSEIILANSPKDVYPGRLIRKHDPLWDMKEHPGAFYVSDQDVSMLIAGDGRVLDGSNRNLWSEYMSGSTTDGLVRSLRGQLIDMKNADRGE